LESQIIISSVEIHVVDIFIKILDDWGIFKTEGTDTPHHVQFLLKVKVSFVFVLGVQLVEDVLGGLL